MAWMLGRCLPIRARCVPIAIPPLRHGDCSAYWPTVAETPQSHNLRIVSPRYGSDVIGGAERLARMLATSLHAAAWQVEVFTTCARDAATWRNVERPGESNDDGISVRRFPVRVTRPPRTFHQFTRAFFRLPPALRPESFWVAAQGPWAPGLVEAVRNATPLPTLFLPYLYHPTLRGLPACPGPRVLLPAAHDERPLRLHAVGAAIAAAGALWYGTDDEREIVEAAHPHAANKPWAVGNVGIVPPARVDPAAFRARVGFHSDDDAPYLLYGGRAATGKGMEDLLEGLRLLRQRRPEVRLVLTGEAGQAALAAPGVLSAGMLDEQTRWDALAGAAAVVIPSFHESLSLLALEAWAVERPVLANAASPVLLGQVLRSGGGFGYHGPTELATAAGDLLSDLDAAAALGRSGQSYVALTYRWEVVHDRLARLIADARG
jgi:glycosyltransferase involved in cell wall biosynthesis